MRKTKAIGWLLEITLLLGLVSGATAAILESAPLSVMTAFAAIFFLGSGLLIAIAGLIIDYLFD